MGQLWHDRPSVLVLDQDDALRGKPTARLAQLAVSSGISLVVVAIGRAMAAADARLNGPINLWLVCGWWALESSG